MCAQSAADYRSPAERQIRDLLADGAVGDALELLTRLLQDRSYDLFREALLHSARNTERERQERLGLLSAEDVRIERQRLIVILTEFLDLIRDREIDLGPIPGNGGGYGGSREIANEARSAALRADAVSSPDVGTTVAGAATRDCVFVCYSRADREWLDRIRRMLQPVIRQNKIDLWDDTRIPVGSSWQAEIQNALARAAIAVLLVSPNFFASSFILDEELPRILDASAQGQLRAIWIHVSDAMFEDTPVAALQAAHDAGTPLDRLPRPEQQSVLKKICLEVKAAVVSAGMD